MAEEERFEHGSVLGGKTPAAGSALSGNQHLEIIQGKTTVSEACRQFDLAPSEIEEWIEQGKAGMENALRAKPEDVREQYEREIKTLQEAYGEAMLELRARKKLQSLLGKEEP